MDPAFEIETEALCGVLDTLDYFQLLDLPRTASPAQIRQAFHEKSRLYHPDRMSALPDSPLKAHAFRIYKRIVEAYVTLRDDQRRERYRADLARPDREKKLRFDEGGEQETKAAYRRQVEEQFGQTPRGRALYRQAQADLEAGRVEAAVRGLKMALTFEPRNARFAELLAQAERGLVHGPRFEIK